MFITTNKMIPVRLRFGCVDREMWVHEQSVYDMGIRAGDVVGAEQMEQAQLRQEMWIVMNDHFIRMNAERMARKRAA